MDDQPPRRMSAAQWAAQLAVDGCHLHDAATSTAPADWNTDAVEDVLEAMETGALTLLHITPEAAEDVSAIGRSIDRVRERLGLPVRDDDAFAVRATAAPSAPTTRRPQTTAGASRRTLGLGPGGRITRARDATADETRNGTAPHGA